MTHRGRVDENHAMQLECLCRPHEYEIAPPQARRQRCNRDAIAIPKRGGHARPEERDHTRHALRGQPVDVFASHPFPYIARARSPTQREAIVRARCAIGESLHSAWRRNAACSCRLLAQHDPTARSYLAYPGESVLAPPARTASAGRAVSSSVRGALTLGE